MAADMMTTTNTPIATPRIVSAARTLLARIESNAMKTPSVSAATRVTMPMLLLLPEGGDRIEPRRAAGRIRSGDDAHRHPHEDADADRPRGNRCGQRRNCRDALREANAQCNPQCGAHRAQCGAFHQKLR